MLIRSPALTEGVLGLAGPGDKAFGFCRADFNQEVGKFAAILHPEDRVRLEQTLQRAVEQGKGSCSYRVRHADGRCRWWFEEVRPLPSSNGDGATLISCVARMTGRVPTPGLRERVRERLEGYLQAMVTDVATTPEFLRVERALRTSEERLSYALKGANDGLWDWDLATDTVYYSPRWKEMLGYADHEVENHVGAWTRLIYPGDQDAIVKQAANFRAGLIPRYEVEFRMRHKAGHWVDILARATLVRDAGGRPLRMVGTHVDITARREAERQLRAMQAQLEQRVRERTSELEGAHTRVATLLQTAPVGIVIYVADGRIVQSNATVGKLLGLSEAEVLGKSLEDPAWRFLREDGSPMPPSEFPVAQVLATRRGLVGQICGIQSGRLPEPVWVYLNAEPSFDEQGQIAEVMLSFMDITTRKQTEAALRDLNASLEQMVARRTESLRVSEQRFRSLAEASFEGVALTQLGLILDCNEQLVRILGCSHDSLLGRTSFDFVPPELQEQVMARFQSADEVDFELEIITGDGRRRIVEVHTRSPDGPQGVRLTAVRDITGRKRMEAELAAQRQELIRFQRMAELSEISAGVIHQIGQPLTAVMNNVSAAKAYAARCSNPKCMALEAMVDSDDCLKQVHMTMSRLRSLIHPERTRRELKDLNAIARGVVELVRKEAGASGIVIVTALTPGLPGVALDEVQISQALINLLRNACEAAAECDPDRREVRASTRVDESGWMTFEVSDRGSGIPPANLERVFEPFFTTKSDGMGVGLTLCRRIVQAHGGSLAAANNEDGPGATFRIRLPLANGGTV